MFLSFFFFLSREHLLRSIIFFVELYLPNASSHGSRAGAVKFLSVNLQVVIAWSNLKVSAFTKEIERKNISITYCTTKNNKKFCNTDMTFLQFSLSNSLILASYFFLFFSFSIDNEFSFVFLKKPVFSSFAVLSKKHNEIRRCPRQSSSGSFLFLKVWGFIFIVWGLSFKIICNTGNSCQ